MIKLTILLLYTAAAAALIKALSGAANSKIGASADSFTGQSRPRALSLSTPVLGLAIALLAFALHSVAVWQASDLPTGLRLGLPNVAALLAWQVALFALLAATRPALRGLGALLLPAAGIAAFFSLTSQTVAESGSPGWRVQSHVILSLLSYGLFTMSALLALLMRAQERSIRRGSPGRFLRLMPPLEAAENALFLCIGAGFALLSLAIFSGLVFVDNLLAQHLVHKTVLSILGWVVYGTLLVGRWRFGWRGETAAGWTLAGFGVLLLAYFGSRIVLELILGRQWS